MKTPVALAALAVAASGCAPTAGMDSPREPRQCFFVNEVRSFASSDDRKVYVRTGSNEVFELTTFSCNNVDWSTSIGVAARGGGSSICSGFDADLIVPDLGTGRRTCPVTAVRRLTEAELAALPARDRP